MYPSNNRRPYLNSGETEEKISNPYISSNFRFKTDRRNGQNSDYGRRIDTYPGSLNYNGNKLDQNRFGNFDYRSSYTNNMDQMYTNTPYLYQNDNKLNLTSRRPKDGKVKWFNNRRGFGYILVDQPPEEVYVHAVDIEKKPPILNEGEHVRFYIVDDNERPSRKAVSVRPLSNSSLINSHIHPNISNFCPDLPPGLSRNPSPPPSGFVSKVPSHALKIFDPKTRRQISPLWKAHKTPLEIKKLNFSGNSFDFPKMSKQLTFEGKEYHPTSNVSTKIPKKTVSKESLHVYSIDKLLELRKETALLDKNNLLLKEKNNSERIGFLFKNNNASLPTSFFKESLFSYYSWVQSARSRSNQWRGRGDYFKDKISIPSVYYNQNPQSYCNTNGNIQMDYIDKMLDPTNTSTEFEEAFDYFYKQFRSLYQNRSNKMNIENDGKIDRIDYSSHPKNELDSINKMNPAKTKEKKPPAIPKLALAASVLAMVDAYNA